jgi:Uncharacterised BCR, YnfA/UPF0060 family
MAQGMALRAETRYGFVATFQPEPDFGRILAAYDAMFVAGSLAWAMVVEGFRPDRYDLVGAALCLAGVALIMYTPPHQLGPDQPAPRRKDQGDRANKAVVRRLVDEVLNADGAGRGGPLALFVQGRSPLTTPPVRGDP